MFHFNAQSLKSERGYVYFFTFCHISKIVDAEIRKWKTVTFTVVSAAKFICEGLPPGGDFKNISIKMLKRKINICRS